MDSIPTPGAELDDWSSEDLVQLKQVLAERAARFEQLKVQREANVAAAASRPDEYFLRKLDSSLKKNTAFIRKLKTITEAQKEVLLRDFQALNLSKYVGEIASSVADAKLKTSDVSVAVELCCAVHQRYADFSRSLLDEYRKLFPRKKDDVVTNPSKLRVDIRVFSELLLVGVFDEKEALQVLGNALGFLVHTDKENFSHASIIQSFVKHCGDIFAGITPRKTRLSALEHKVDLPPCELVSPDRQASVAGLLRDYYDALSKKAVGACDRLRKQEAHNKRTLLTRGDVHPEATARQEQSKVEFDKLWTLATTFADLLDCELPTLPEPIVVEEECPSTEGDGAMTAAPGMSPWEDEDAQHFYDSLPELKFMLPGILFKDSVEPKLEPLEDKISDDEEGEPTAVEGAEGKESEQPSADAAEGDAKDEQPEEDKEETPEADNEENTEGEEGARETPSPEENQPMPLLLKEFLAQLPNTINRDLIDKAAVEFTTHLNTAGNRAKLAAALYTVHRNRLDLLPFYARLVAVLNPVMPDVGTELVQKLLSGFRREIRMKNQLHLDTKIKIVRFIGELVKFRIFPKSEALHCLKMLLFDFRHHNIDMCCNLLDVCGYFLFHSPDSHYKAKFLVESMLRKKQSAHLDQRYQLMVDNAYYSCVPPTGEAIQTRSRPPLHTFIQKLLYFDLSEAEVENSLRLLRKLDWNDPEVNDYVVKCFSRPWRVRYDQVYNLASLLAGVSYYYDDVAVAVLDQILEDIRVGMEINNPKFNQRRIACVRYLGEMYNYRVVDSSIVFHVLYSFITFGVIIDPPGGGSPALLQTPVDPHPHLLRIRLACTLLDTCGHYFDRGKSRKKLDCYLLYLQRYYWLKKSAPVWTPERPFPLEVDNVLQDTLDFVRPGKAPLSRSLADAVRAVDEMQTQWMAKLEGMMLVQEQQRKDGLAAINEVDEEDEDEGSTDQNEEERESPEQEEEEELSEGAYYDEEDGTLRFLHTQPRRDLCPEDDAFRDAFDKMLTDSAQARLNDTSKIPVADFSVPMSIRTKSKIRFAEQQESEEGEAEEEEGEAVFAFLTRGKGNKTVLKTIKVPEESSLAQSVRSREQELQQEKAQMKRLTLDMTERMQEEEQAAATQEFVSSLFTSEARRTNFQHPRGAPNTKHIFHDNWR